MEKRKIDQKNENSSSDLESIKKKEISLERLVLNFDTCETGRIIQRDLKNDERNNREENP